MDRRREKATSDDGASRRSSVAYHGISLEEEATAIDEANASCAFPLEEEEGTENGILSSQEVSPSVLQEDASGWEEGVRRISEAGSSPNGGPSTRRPRQCSEGTVVESLDRASARCGAVEGCAMEGTRSESESEREEGSCRRSCDDGEVVRSPEEGRNVGAREEAEGEATVTGNEAEEASGGKSGAGILLTDPRLGVESR